MQKLIPVGYPRKVILSAFLNSVGTVEEEQIWPKKNICVFQDSALKKLDMIGWHYHFILLKYFVLIFHFSLHFPPFFSIFDYTFLKIHNKMFMVRAKT